VTGPTVDASQAQVKLAGPCALPGEDQGRRGPLCPSLVAEGDMPMNTTAPQATSYSVTRFTVDVPRSLEDFQRQYERAVPPLPREHVDALVARGAPRSEINKLIASAA
jgi:hypothetical protein